MHTSLEGIGNQHLAVKTIEWGKCRDGERTDEKTEHRKRKSFSFVPQCLVCSPERVDIAVACCISSLSDGKKEQGLELCMAECMEEGG